MKDARSTVNWSLRLGLLVPSANAVMERDAQRLLPPSVSLHTARMPLTRDDEDQIASLATSAPAAARTLADAGVDVIGFACTTGSLLEGNGYDQRIIAELEQVAGVPVTTTSTAVVEALQTVGASRLLLLSPYPHWLQQRVVVFLESHGFTVVANHYWDRPDPRDIEAVTPQEIVDEALRRATDGVDGVFISCTGFRGFEAVEGIEAAMGVPAIASNQATLWHLLRLVGEPLRLDHCGRLFL